MKVEGTLLRVKQGNHKNPSEINKQFEFLGRSHEPCYHHLQNVAGDTIYLKLANYLADCKSVISRVNQ